MKARKLTLKDVAFTLECEPEMIAVRGNALASGDDAEDRKTEDRILAELDNGNEWAWCTVILRGRYKGLVATDTLGCCSCDSQADFEKNSGYYDDMRDTVLGELQAQLNAIIAEDAI